MRLGRWLLGPVALVMAEQQVSHKLDADRRMQMGLVSMQYSSSRYSSCWWWWCGVGVGSGVGSGRGREKQKPSS